MFFIIRFILFWTIWILLADKKRWREILPVCLLAGFLGSLADRIFIDGFKLWDFNHTSPLLKYVLDDLGIYIVVTYLFIQWIPKNNNNMRLITYFFIWTGFCISIEWIYIKLGYMEHHTVWNLGFSYIADWFLFWVFYQYYKVFQFKKLSTRNNDYETLKASMDSSPLAIIALDKSKKVILWNSVSEKIFGWRKESILGTEIPIIPQEERDKFESISRKKLEGETLYNLKMSLQKKCGSKINCIYSTGPLFSNTNNIIGTMTIITSFDNDKFYSENSTKEYMQKEDKSLSKKIEKGKEMNLFIHTVSKENG